MPQLKRGIEQGTCARRSQRFSSQELLYKIGAVSKSGDVHYGGRVYFVEMNPPTEGKVQGIDNSRIIKRSQLSILALCVHQLI